MLRSLSLLTAVLLLPCALFASDGEDFFERRVRPILVERCYECHSEKEGEQQGGLLLDRQSGWLQGGEMGKAVVPGNLQASLLVAAINYDRDDLQMPPDARLPEDEISILLDWIQHGANAPEDDLGETDFSRLGDQEYLFSEAKSHWAFQPVTATDPPNVRAEAWNQNAIDRFVFARMVDNGLRPSAAASHETMARRLSFVLTGLPPQHKDVERFRKRAEEEGIVAATTAQVDHLLNTSAYGQHIGRMWLDVARYADTDSAYRPDTRTPHYFPFAFTYRDYVVDAYNEDKPYDQFVIEQLAADLTDTSAGADKLAALGFLGIAPHANRSQAEALDDWIDVTTRGLMGLTAACARCHDHKFEPVPTADYYSLRGVFAGLVRPSPLDETKQPVLASYQANAADRADYEKQRAEIEKKIKAGAGKKVGNNAVPEKIRETELAKLLAFHPGAPARAMVIEEKKRIPPTYVFLRGDARNRGKQVPRRFLEILDPDQTAFSDANSGRYELARSIVSHDNPLTARVYVNRVWGHVMGSYLVRTPSDFGLQGERPTHPQLLDWLTADFVQHGWSTKHLVRRIVNTATFRQAVRHQDEKALLDPENRFLWRANRRHLSIESIRDSLLFVSGTLDRRMRGRPGQLWDENYTHRRAIYGFVNRFNLDPTLRAFDFANPMQSQPKRGESIVAPQALFTLNAKIVVDQAAALVDADEFTSLESDDARITSIFRKVLQRDPADQEMARVKKFVAFQERFKKPSTRFIDSPWPLVAQSLMMSNEFQYVD